MIMERHTFTYYKQSLKMAASIDVLEWNVLLNKFREFVNSSCYKCDCQENSTKENLIHIIKDITAALRLDENR